MKRYDSQLKSLVNNLMVTAAGGFVYVAATGTTAKLALKDKTGAALANPLPLTNGSFLFYTDDSVVAVDLFVQSPTGHFIVAKNIKPSADSSLYVDTSLAHTTMVIPFNVVDQAGDATETPCGFTAMGAVQPNVAIEVVDTDAAITIDVGTLSTDSGDADGFMDGVSTATAGYVKATLLASGDTMGALLSVLDSANSGDDAPEQDVSMIGKQITYTLLTAADTAAGYIILPQQLPVSRL